MFLKKVRAAYQVTAGDEVEQAFLKAIKEQESLEWGSQEQIDSENKPFLLAEKHGWKAEKDNEFWSYSMKATTEEMLKKGLECYKKFQSKNAKGA